MQLLWEHAIGDNTIEGGTDFLPSWLMSEIFDLGNSVAYVHSAFLNGHSAFSNEPGVSRPKVKPVQFIVVDELDKKTAHTP
jgi:hypothetical protein